MKRTNQTFEEIFLVASDQAMAKSGNISASGNAVNLSDKQLGLIAATNKQAHLSAGDFLGATNDPAGSGTNDASEVPAVQLVQGTPASSDTSNLVGWHYEDQAFVKGPIMRQNRIKSFTLKKANIGRYHAVLGSGFGTPVSEKDYKLFIEFRSVRNHRDYGANVEQLPVVFKTPDYSALSLTNNLDHLLQNVAYNANLNSKAVNTPEFRGNKAMVVFGINTGGGSGTVIGDIAVGDNVDFVTIGGTTYSINVTKQMLRTLTEAAANTAIDPTTLTGSTIEVIDPTTAGAAANVDMLLVVGLTHDRSKAYDGIYAENVRVDVEFGGEFQKMPSLTTTLASGMQEDQGRGDQLKIEYDNRAFNQGTLQLTGHQDELLLPPVYFNTDANTYYTQAIIDLYDSEETLTVEPISQKRVRILIPATDDSSTATVADDITSSTDASTLLSDLEALVKPWLSSNTNVELLGDATASVYFA